MSNYEKIKGILTNKKIKDACPDVVVEIYECIYFKGPKDYFEMLKLRSVMKKIYNCIYAGSKKEIINTYLIELYDCINDEFFRLMNKKE